MEKIFLFNVSGEAEEVIARAAGNMRIKVGVIAPELYTETLENIADGKAASHGLPAAAAASDAPSEASLILMCGLSDKHMDRLLARLRQSAARVDYKAVLTPANSRWSLKRLLLELEKEQRAMKG